MNSYLGQCRNFLYNRLSFVSFQQKASLKTSAEGKIGLPLKPKRPPSAFLRYSNLLRSSLKEKLSVPEMARLASEHWKKEDPKVRARIEEEIQKEWTQYSLAKAEYDKLITPEQKEAIYKVKLEKIEADEKRNLKKKCADLGRPKRPVPAYLRFTLSRRAERGDTPFSEWQKQMSEEWNSTELSEKEKMQSDVKLEMEKYKIELAKWEEKMLKLGHFSVVRSETLAKITTAKE